MVVLWLEGGKRQKRQVPMKLIASLAPARAVIEAGVVAKADQKFFPKVVMPNLTQEPSKKQILFNISHTYYICAWSFI